MSINNFTVANFFKEMNDVDPDHRCTALFFLIRELDASPKISFTDSDQDKIMNCLVKSLNEQESHSDVHANAIQVLTTLTPKIKENYRVALIRELARCVHGDVKAADPRFPLQMARIASLRDNAGIALKNMVEACSAEETQTGIEILRAVFDKFATASQTKTKSEILDVGSTVIKQFGATIQHEHYASAFKSARASVDEKDWGLRRRAMLVIAQLSLYVPQEEFAAVLDDVVAGLEKPGTDRFRNRAQLASAISQRAGTRFASKVSKVLELLTAGIEQLGEDDSPESDDIRENILNAYEHIVCQCAGSVNNEQLLTMISDCVKLLNWDPNFAMDDELDEDDAGAGGMPMSQESQEEVYEGMMCREGTVTSFDEVIDEADDSSWKVRRASAHCLAQTIRARPDSVDEALLFAKIFKPGNDVFFTRLRDRVESVQQEVCGLLQGIFEVSQSTGHLKALATRSNPIVRTLLGALKGSVSRGMPNIGATCLVNIRTAFTLFPGIEWPLVAKASTALNRAISSPSFASPVIKPEAVRAASAVMMNVCENTAGANKAELSDVFGPLAKFIFDCSHDKSIKTSSSAVGASAVLVRVGLTFPAEAGSFVKDVFSTLEDALGKSDVDHEVKRTAIDATCALLNAAAGPLVQQVADAPTRLVKVTVELIKNEGLRPAALPMLALAASSLPLPPASIGQIVSECTSLLKKADRQVREGALRSLNGVLTAHGKEVGEAQATEIVKLASSVSSLISDSELFLAVLCLQMLRAAVGVGKAAATTFVNNSLLNDALNLTKSTQPLATQEISDLVSAVVTSDASLTPKVLSAALNVAASTTDARALPHIAQVLASIVAADIAAGGSGGAKKHLDELISGAGASKAYAIPLFGELGRATDLSQSAPKALELLNEKLVKGNDEEKNMASSALGRVASSARNSGVLGAILTALGKEGTETSKYFYLRALREAVNSAVADMLIPSAAATAGKPVSADGATPVAATAGLFAEADSKIAAPLLTISATLAVADDSVTIPIVGECLGRSALLAPEKVVPMLVAALTTSGVAESTALCVTQAMRFVVLASPQRANLRHFLEDKLAPFNKAGVCNASHRVRRAALLLVQTSVSLIGGSTFDVKNDLPTLLKLVAVDKGLQTSIDVGLFVHVKDSGLEMRRAAVEALATLVHPQQVQGASGSGVKMIPIALASDTAAVVTTVANSLGCTKDETEPDLQTAARSILLKLADIPQFAAQVVAHIDKIADALRLSIVAKVKDGADADAVRDNCRSAAMTALKLAPRAVHSAKLVDAVKAIKTSPLLAQEHDSLVARAKED